MRPAQRSSRARPNPRRRADTRPVDSPWTPMTSSVVGAGHAALREDRDGRDHRSDPANADESLPLARFPWCSLARDDVGRRAGERHDHRSRQLHRALRIRQLGLRLSDARHRRRVRRVPGPCRQEEPGHRLRHDAPRLHGNVDGGRRPVVHAVGPQPLQGHQGEGRRRAAVRVHLPHPGPAVHDHELVRQGGLQGPRERLLRIHDRLRRWHRHRRGVQALGTAPVVRRGHVPARGTAHRRELGALSDAAADRIDALPDRLRRVPAAELHPERTEEPAAAVLQRIRRER